MKLIRVGFCPACGAQKSVEIKREGAQTTVRVYCSCGGCEEETEKMKTGEPYGLEIVPIEFGGKDEDDAGRNEDDL